MKKAYMVVEVTYNPATTDALEVSDALDHLMDNARSTPGIMDEVGDPAIGAFFPIDPEDIQILGEVAQGPITQPQKDALDNILQSLGAIQEPSDGEFATLNRKEPPVEAFSCAALQEAIEKILLENGESFQADKGVDKQVCKEVAAEIVKHLLSHKIRVMVAMDHGCVRGALADLPNIDFQLHDFDEFEFEEKDAYGRTQGEANKHWEDCQKSMDAIY